jgi:hypothetical protein
MQLAAIVNHKREFGLQCSMAGSGSLFLLRMLLACCLRLLLGAYGAGI